MPGKDPRDARYKDTPGRPKPESSRQQTLPDQGADTGNEELDAQDIDAAKKLRRDSARLKGR